MLEYVGDMAKNYSKRAYKKALMARKFQNIIMRPSTRKYKDVVISHMPGCPITKADIQAAENIDRSRARLYVAQTNTFEKALRPYPRK
jgi:hypothetical protein